MKLYINSGIEMRTGMRTTSIKYIQNEYFGMTTTTHELMTCAPSIGPDEKIGLAHTMCMHACEASVCIDVVAVAFAIVVPLLAVAVAV